MLSSYNAVLIGNTKAVWPKFVNWLVMKVEEKKIRNYSSDCMRTQHEEAVDDVIHTNPFDTYCEESLSRSLQELCCRDDANKIKSYELFWANGKPLMMKLEKKNLL